MGVGREAGRAMRRLLQFPGRETVAEAPLGGPGEAAVPVGRSGSTGVTFSRTCPATTFRVSCCPSPVCLPQVHEPGLQGVGDV